MTERRVESVNEFMSDDHELLRLVAQGVNALLRGQGNYHFNVTLVSDATETSIPVFDAVENSQASFHPRSASAATAIASGAIWTECQNGLVIIHHDSTPDTDRLLGVRLHG